MKAFNIEVDERTFYERYLALMNPMFGLRPNARKVLADMMYYNDKYRGYSDEERGSMLFVRRVKDEIEKRHGMTSATIDNQFTYLRTKGFLNGLLINPKYTFSHRTHADTLFSFKITE